MQMDVLDNAAPDEEVNRSQILGVQQEVMQMLQPTLKSGIGSVDGSRKR